MINTFNQNKEIQRNDNFFCYEPVDISWQDSIFTSLARQQIDICSIIGSIQSPIIVPKFIPESPVFPIKHDDSNKLMEGIKTNLYENPDMMITKQDQAYPSAYRKGSMNIENFQVDQDGFRRPVGVRIEKYAAEPQESIRKKSATDFIPMTPPMNIISPLMIPDMMTPFPQPEDRNPNMFPINTVFAPILTPRLVAPPYSPEAMRHLHIGNSEYSNEQNRIQESTRKISELDLRINESINENGCFYSPFVHPSPDIGQTPIQSSTIPEKPQDDFKLDDDVNMESKPDSNPIPERMIGALTVSQRKEKIRKYFEKRKRRIWKKKISYDCRKKVADKRLRIKGRFVTRDQAYELLGTTAKELSNNELLRTLAVSNDNYCIITCAQNMKIRNVQNLFAEPESKKNDEVKNNKKSTSEETKIDIDHKLKVEILKKNSMSKTLEIKIESAKESNQTEQYDKFHQRDDERLPKILNPIFKFKRLKPDEYNSKHEKYHKTLNAL